MKLLRLLMLFAGLLFFAPVAADAADPACPNAEVLTGKLITDICWSCLFPIKVAGIPLGFGSGGNNIPDGASDRSLCICFDNVGIPQPGMVTAMWEPARLLEIVRLPGCSPSLGGIRLPLSDIRQMGRPGEGVYDHGDKAFYHYHMYAFPLLIMMDLFVNRSCVSDGYMDFDLIYLSEIDPTWNNDELAFFTNPEASIVANPIAQAACMADAGAATAGKALDSMFWCAGSWGSMYPFSGHDSAAGSLAENTNLLATRAMAASHRRGLSWRTMGNDALCGSRIEPMMPKSQYKWTMFFPWAETQNSHAVGESTFLWGENTKIPALGEDALFLLWRWHDCCTKL